MAKPPLFKVQEILIDTAQVQPGSLIRTSTDDKIMEIILNNTAERTSASNKDNYKIKLKNKKVEIEKINVAGRFISIYFEDRDLTQAIKADPDLYLPDLLIEFGDIYDHDHNKLNEPVYEEVHQFRELFRQKVTTDPAPAKHIPFINRDTTLSANINTLEKMENLSNYWMNTPLKK